MSDDVAELTGSQEGVLDGAAPTLPALCYQSSLLTLHLLLLKSGKGNLIIYLAITLQPVWHVAMNCTKPPATDCEVINRCRTYITGVTCSCRAGLQINDIYEVSCCSWLPGCQITGFMDWAAAASLPSAGRESKPVTGTSSQRNLVERVPTELKAYRLRKMILCKSLYFQGVLRSQHSLYAMPKPVSFIHAKPCNDLVTRAT